MNQSFVPIETEVGIIHGRDAIFLDEITFFYQKHQTEFLGELNGSSCSKITDKNEYLKYSLIFDGVLAFRMTELDFGDFIRKSNFDSVENSDWIKEMRKFDSANKITPEHKHYFLQTYDDIFEIISKNFEFKILSSRSKE